MDVVTALEEELDGCSVVVEAFVVVRVVVGSIEWVDEEDMDVDDLDDFLWSPAWTAAAKIAVAMIGVNLIFRLLNGW